MPNEYNVQVEIYDDAAPTVLLAVIHARTEPSCLSEINGHGAGSFRVSKDDPKILASPTLIDYRKIVRMRLNGVVIGAFVIQTKTTVIVGEGEEASESWEISGEGLRSWSRDAAVYPALGLKQKSADTRYFNFAVAQGSWYNPANWTTAVNISKWNSTGNWWKTAPAEWPDVPNAYWVWDRNSPKNMPQGYVYFRHEFTVSTASMHSLFVAIDDAGEVYVDGELLYTTSESGWQETNRIDFDLEPGPHVIGIKAYNKASTGPGALLAALFRYGDPLEPTSAVRLSYTGQSTWKVYGYPAIEPGWSIGNVVLTLLAEAAARGVRFALNITTNFTGTHDTAGVAWGDPVPWSFAVGATYEEVISAVEEMGCDVWLNPDTLVLNIWKKRGTDYSTGDNTLNLIPGHNLLSATETGQAQIANALMLHAKDGWKEEVSSVSASQSKYGRIETQMSTDLAYNGAKPLVDELFRLKSLPELSATFDIVPVPGIVPFVNFNVGDTLSAPTETPGIRAGRRVMSIAYTEDFDTGAPLYSVEFDTIFKDRQQELEKWVSRIANSSAIGGGFTNSSVLPPTAQQGLPPANMGITPDAPTGLVVSSVAQYAPDGSAIADYGLTWNPVVSGEGMGTEVEIDRYEVFGRLSTEPDSALMTVVFDVFAYLTGFRSGDTWVFKVRAISRTGGPGEFSAEVSLEADAPLEELEAPSAPTLESSLGIVIVSWDGILGSDPAPGQFRELIVQRKDLGTWVKIGSLLGGSYIDATQPVGSEPEYRFIARDSFGGLSDPSTSASIVVEGITAPDLDPDLGDTITSASGAVTTSPNAPEEEDGEGKPNGALWYQFNENNTVIGQWRWDGTEWVFQDFGDDVLSQIDAGKILTGYLDAARIVAGSITSEHVAAEAITAEHIAAESIHGSHISSETIEANHISAGAIQVSHLDAGVGGALDISANEQIQFVVGLASDAQDSADATSEALHDHQMVYTFDESGATISAPGTEDGYSLKLSNTGAQILQGTTPVSWWDAGQFYVNSLVGSEVILGNHKIERYGNDTVMRAL